MASIQLTDKFGLDINAQAAPRSALLKYFQQLPSLRFDTLDLAKVGGLTLEQPALLSLSTGLSFQDPINLGDGAPAFSIGAGAHGSLQIIDDPYLLPMCDDPPEPLKDACYVSFGIEATACATVGVTSGKLQFGASPSTKLEAVSYSRFPLKTGVTLLQAIQQTVAGFSIPACSDDLADMAAGQIAKVAVSGKLTVSGTVDLLAIANPLASASLPAPLPVVSVSAGGSVTIGVSSEIETEYEIVAHKLDTGAVRVGWSHQRGTAVTVSAQISEALSAGFGSSDAFSLVVRAISGDPQADLKELTSAGVAHEQALQIQGAVKAATNRTLGIAIASAITTSDSDATTFLYEIVPGSLTAESRTAVDQALRGDLTGLHTPGLAGVTCVQSIWENVRKVGVELNVNLLGILNYRSIASLSLEGTVLYDPATGSLVISDQATAKRIESTQINFGADTAKLRHVLAESFFITAAYQAAKQLAGAPSLRSSHTFFELQASTSLSDMARMMRTGLALGLLSIGEAVPPASAAGFGRTLFTASTDYDEALVSGMFLDTNDTPLPREQYETAGRNAIQFLVQASDLDAVRRTPAMDDELWSRMKEVGQPGFAGLFPGVPAPFVAAIAADYSTIQWWADAMHDTAQELATMRLWLARNPGAAFEDPEFQKLRQALANYLRGVAANTREEFGQPWGLIAMNQLASRRAGAKIQITGPTLVISKGRALVGVAGA